VWRVKFPTLEDRKYKIKAYKSRELAEVACAKFKLVQRKAGDEAAESATSTELINWKIQSKELAKYGLTVEGVLEERLIQLRAIKTHETLYNALGEYLAVLKNEDASTAYLADIQTRCSKFLRDIGKERLCDTISLEEVATWLEGLKVNHVTRDNYRRVLSAFFRWCEKKKYVSGKIVPDANKTALKRAENRKVINYLTLSEVADLLITLDQAESLPMKIAYLLKLFCGVRTSELRKQVLEDGVKKDVYLTMRDIDLEDETVFISGQLSKKQGRVIEMPSCCVVWIRKWMKDSDEVLSVNAPFVPSNSNRSMRNFNKKHGIVLTQNVLRHTYSTYLSAKIGGSETATQMGNSSGVVATHYARPVKKASAERFFALVPEVVLENKVEILRKVAK